MRCMQDSASLKLIKGWFYYLCHTLNNLVFPPSSRLNAQERPFVVRWLHSEWCNTLSKKEKQVQICNVLELTTIIKKQFYQERLITLLTHKQNKKLKIINLPSLSDLRKEISEKEQSLWKKISLSMYVLSLFKQSITLLFSFQKPQLAINTIDAAAKKVNFPIFKEDLPPELALFVQQFDGILFVGIDLATMAWLGSSYQLISGLSECLLAQINLLEKLAAKTYGWVDEITLIEKTRYLNWFLSVMLNGIFSFLNGNFLIPSTIAYIAGRFVQNVLIDSGLKWLSHFTGGAWLNTSILKYLFGTWGFSYIHQYTAKTLTDYLYPSLFMDELQARDILGIEQEVVLNEGMIKKYFHKLSLLCHPDKLHFGECPQGLSMTNITHAQDVLMNSI